MSNKANEDMLNSLHSMTAIKLAELIKQAEGEPELMIKVLREVKTFLKDNNVTAEMSPQIRQLEQEAVEIAELPFEVEED